MTRFQSALFAIIIMSVAASADAQFFGGDPGAMADRFFGMMDRNRNGRLEEDEVQRMPGPMRDAMQRMGADFRRGVSQDKFSEIMPRAMEEMRRSGGFGGPPSRGGSSGYGDRSRYGDRDRGSDDRGDRRGPSDYRRDDDRSRDSRYRSDSRGDSRGRSSRGSSKPSPPPRITVDLPESWKVADLDQDGQIGLYEWDRKKYKEFFALDTNGDSLLTPREISRASDASPAPTTAIASVAASTGPSRSTPTAKPAAPVKSAPSGAPLTAVEYDEKSAEGRWAKYVFGRLDKDKDGSLTPDEWNASAKTRDSFKKHNAQITLPAKFESFAGLMVAVQRAERKK